MAIETIFIITARFANRPAGRIMNKCHIPITQGISPVKSYVVDNPYRNFCILFLTVLQTVY